MNEHKFTAEDLVRAIDLCYFTKGENICQKCPLRGVCRDDIQMLEKLTRSLIIHQGEQIERLIKERNEARRDCAVAEKNHQTAIDNFKSALLKKIFPYDAADKKQYSINAYAVERAIIETEVQYGS